MQTIFVGNLVPVERLPGSSRTAWARQHLVWPAGFRQDIFCYGIDALSG
jgi:hypothetical protein